MKQFETNNSTIGFKKKKILLERVELFSKNNHEKNKKNNILTRNFVYFKPFWGFAQKKKLLA